MKRRHGRTCRACGAYYHMEANFFSQFRSKNLMNMFKKLCKKNQEHKYNFRRHKLDEFTKEHVKQRKAARAVSIAAHAEAVAAQGTTVPEVTEPNPISLCDLPGFDPPNTRMKTGRWINFFAKWIEHGRYMKCLMLPRDIGVFEAILNATLT
jgi:hypothetical protein